MSTDTGNFGGLLGDYFDGGAGNRAPAVAWGENGKDFTVEGVLVDIVKSEQTKPGTKRGDPDHILRFESGDARTQLEFTLQTTWRDYEGIGEDTVEKMKTDGRVDDGRRRVFVKGSPRQPTTTAGAFAEAVKNAGVTMGEVAIGATVAFKQIGRHTNPYGGSKIPDFAARYARPTAETIALVQKDEAKPAGDDPWAADAAVKPAAGGTKGSGYPDDPPF